MTQLPPDVKTPRQTLGGSVVLQVIALAATLLLFFVALELMGESFKLMGQGFAEALLAATKNPFVALFAGILATSLVQSSSTTTSLTVALVASGTLDLSGAIPIILGANIGTTVTNTIVSMGYITRPEEFRRALAGATVHDFFNWFAVLVLLPLELAFGILSKPATALAGGIEGVGGLELLSPLKIVVDPIVEYLIEYVLASNGIVALVAGLAALFLALRYLVVLLKALVLGRIEGYLDRYVFGNAIVAMGFGMVITALVQSSSVTTSLIIPLVGAGILTVRQIFPYTLGANVGTTITALLAALALAASAAPTEPAQAAAQVALAVALAHVLFNVFGIGLIYPLKVIREIPIRLAEFIGNQAFRNRLAAIAYLVGLFYLLPLALIFVF